MRNFIKNQKTELIIILIFLILFPIQFLFFWMDTLIKSIIYDSFTKRTNEFNDSLYLLINILFLILSFFSYLKIKLKLKYFFFILYLLFLSTFFAFAINYSQPSIILVLLLNSLFTCLTAIILLLFVKFRNVFDEN
ncbi:hypothetical protein BWK58_15015 [Flavobacterium columnare]|nr:hypothetical protein BWK58_15015 [Flavobacterium columnare]